MTKNKELIIIGVGSSAGGLEALQAMLSRVDTSLECAYIIAQHLSPTHRSMMVELLSRVTNLPVIEIQNGMIIKAKSIYMTPENTDVYVTNGKIYLKSIESTYGPKPSVNYFFNSLAQSYGSRSIGIILSGTGSDGAFGIRSIKASGGITIAQSPASAKYDGMPIAAMNTGKVDLVVPIDEMANEISRIINNLGKNVADSINEQMLQQIYRILFNEKGVDFSQYKRSTLTRRIERRMAALKVESLSDYIDVLKSDLDEILALYHDVLIGVTEFFRDRDAFDALYPYLNDLLEKKEAGEEIRLWVIGCSTGEEAYTLAILLCEILKERITRYKIKIFATDIDDEALKIARSGIYSETSFINVDKTVLQRYFSIQKNQFEVKKTLRELVIFSRHNIISDSPFLRLDLISCRNMLIYFNQALQNRFFPIVHYALKEQGILFLGKSESIGQNGDLFITLDKNEKIFKSQFTGIKEPPKLYNYAPVKGYEEPRHSRFRNEDEILEEGIIAATLKYMMNQCVVINSSNEIVYIKGEIPYLVHPEGRATNNIFKSLREELVLDLRTAINEAMKYEEIRMTPFRSVVLSESTQRYSRIVVIPFKAEDDVSIFFILFFQTEGPDALRGNVIVDNTDDEAVVKLSNELNLTKAHLQNVIEELETSYEEMQSLNEELSSSNEELQSSNEELETTNEELQSTNEELQTAYTELKTLYEDKENRAKQLEELTQKLMTQSESLRKQKEISEGIINTTPIAITMVDIDGKITFANTNALNLFKITKQQIINRSYDSEKWRITALDGSFFPPEQLPFSRIRQTFEPVHNVRHALHDGEDKSIFVSVSGAPLFDAKGSFVGAVFSIQNISDSEQIDREVLRSYETKLIDESISRSLQKFHSEKIDEKSDAELSLFQYTLNELSLKMRTHLNDLLLLCHTLGAATPEPSPLLLSEIQRIIETMGKEVSQSHETFALGSFVPISFQTFINQTLLHFEEWFKENNIHAVAEIGIDIFVNARGAKVFMMALMEHMACIARRNPLAQTNFRIRSEQRDSSVAFEFILQIPGEESFDRCLFDRCAKTASDYLNGTVSTKRDEAGYTISLTIKSSDA